MTHIPEILTEKHLSEDTEWPLKRLVSEEASIRGGFGFRDGKDH